MQPPIFEKNLDIKQKNLDLNKKILTLSKKCIILLKSQGRNGSMPRDCRAAVRTILYPWLFYFLHIKAAAVRGFFCV